MQFGALNFQGGRTDGTTALRCDAVAVASHFFGQSSFASHAIAYARNAVKVSQDAPLELLGPLGCGIMTGAGAVLNTFGRQARLVGAGDRRWFGGAERGDGRRIDWVCNHHSGRAVRNTARARAGRGVPRMRSIQHPAALVDLVSAIRPDGIDYVLDHHRQSCRGRGGAGLRRQSRATGTGGCATPT